MEHRFHGAIALSALLGACGPSAREAVLPPPLAAPEPAVLPQAGDEIVHLEAFDLRNPLAGQADASAIVEVLLAEAEDLLACWGTSLGQVSLSLEIDPRGGVVGGSTEPAGGQEGLAAVADCALEEARTWRFPRSESEAYRVFVVPLRVGAASSSAER